LAGFWREIEIEKGLFEDCGCQKFFFALSLSADGDVRATADREVGVTP